MFIKFRDQLGVVQNAVAAGVMTLSNFLLAENGDRLLAEDGQALILEQ